MNEQEFIDKYEDTYKRIKELEKNKTTLSIEISDFSNKNNIINEKINKLGWRPLLYYKMEYLLFKGTLMGFDETKYSSSDVVKEKEYMILSSDLVYTEESLQNKKTDLRMVTQLVENLTKKLNELKLHFIVITSDRPLGTTILFNGITWIVNKSFAIEKFDERFKIDSTTKSVFNITTKTNISKQSVLYMKILEALKVHGIT